MRGRIPRDYGWLDAQAQLADGVHPEVVAARLGEPVDMLLDTADAQGWPVTWNGSPKRTFMAVDLDA